MIVAAASDTAVVAAWVAVAGTLSGAVVVGVLQGWQARRQRQSLEREGAAQREAARQALDRQIKEERFQRLRSERREVYSKLLDLADEWRSLIQELRDSDLPGGSVRNVAEAREAMPVAAQNLEMMDRVTRVLAEVELLADAEVRAAAVLLQDALRGAFKAAVLRDDAVAAIAPTRQAALAAMRRELVHG
jgi:hypothetical protein